MGSENFLLPGACERRDTKQKETLICCALALLVSCGAGVALIYFT